MSAPMRQSAIAREDSCHNCGAALHGPFCAACGQEARPLTPRLRDLLREMAHEWLDVDGRTLRSIRALFLQPGLLTREQFAGRRVRWLSPLKLYLIFSVAYFGAVAIGGTNMTVRVTATDRNPTAGRAAGPANAGSANANANANANGAGGVAGSRANDVAAPARVDEDERAAFARLGYKSADEFRQAAGRAQAIWMPRVMFVLVPLFAALVHLTRRRGDWSYPQHLWFALHVHAAAFGVGALMVVAAMSGWTWLSSLLRPIIVLYMSAYTVIALRESYGGTTRRALLHAAIVFPVYALLVLSATLAIIAPLLWKTGAS